MIDEYERKEALHREAVDVRERMIHAAGVDYRRKVMGARPAGYGSAMPAYVHTFADMNGWRREPGDKLQREDFDRYGNHRKEQLDPRRLALTPQDVSDLEECESWVVEFVRKDENRRALWAWAKAKAGVREAMPGHPGETRRFTFERWCRDEKVATLTGSRRKDRAISQIEYELSRKLLQNNEIDRFGVLFETASKAYLQPTFEEEGERGILTWRDDPGLMPAKTRRGQDGRTFSWREERNELRRKRYGAG